MAETPLNRILARRCRQALIRRGIVVSRGTPDGVHDLRVATRRLQEILDFLKPVLPSRPRRRLSRRARRIRRSLGQIRNVDVTRDLVRELGRRCTNAQRRHLKPLAVRLTTEARALRDAGHRTRGLTVPGLRGLVERLGNRLRPPNGFSALLRAREILTARVAELDEAVPAARTGKTGPLHALRIAIKRHRYALEILEESGLRQTRPAIAAARALQNDLGELHDLDVLMALVRDKAGPAAARVLLPHLRGERRERLADALKAIGRFDPSAALLIVEKALAREAAA